MISLNADKLTKMYNRKLALREISFEHTQGVLGIAGVNGSGKSTLLMCLAYLIQPSAGKFSWNLNGSHVTKTEARSVMGFAAPYLNLYEDLSLIENLEFLGEISRKNHEKEYYRQLLEQVHMLKFENRMFKSLSTGQQQRVKLAAALVRKPKILLLDEPGSNLDKDGHLLVKQIVEEQARGGALVIIASNDSKELELCDNIIQLEPALTNHSV